MRLVVRWLKRARKHLGRGSMYEINTSPAVGVMPFAGASCRHFGRDTPGFKQPAAV